MNKSTAAQEYDTTIGIETHVQLKTTTKLFCRCLNDPTAEEPNLNICPICMGLPGTLPYLNSRAIELAIQVGLALNGQIAKATKFDRKHYFYPDLPKGYQISQYDQPIITQGSVDVPFKEGMFKVGIIRAHLEEDAGKSLHPAGADYSLVDLNRVGTPLMEIVSAPDIKNPAEAKAYVQELYLIMLYGRVSDVDLFRGNMRFDVNVSVRKPGAKKLGLRSEIKNLNSFRNVEKASQYEVNRQIDLLAKGQQLTQSTRGWDEAKAKTYDLRTKEFEADYRYFPEPDIPPLVITTQMKQAAQKTLPDLPKDIRQSLALAELSAQQSQTLLLNPRLVEIFLEAVKQAKPAQVKRIASWLVRDIKTFVSQPGFKWDSFKLEAERLKQLAKLVEEGKLSSNGAEQVLKILIHRDADPAKIAEAEGVLQISDTGKIDEIVETVINQNSEAVSDYQKGNQRSLQFLVGQVMKLSRGQANPQLAAKLLKQRLEPPK